MVRMLVGFGEVIIGLIGLIATSIRSVCCCLVELAFEDGEMIIVDLLDDGLDDDVDVDVELLTSGELLPLFVESALCG